MNSISIVDWVNLAAGLATLIAAVFAFFTVRSWRREYRGRRKYELIEDAISLIESIDKQLIEHLSKDYDELFVVWCEEGTGILLEPTILAVIEVKRIRTISKGNLDELNILGTKLCIYASLTDLDSLRLIATIFDEIDNACNNVLSASLHYKHNHRHKANGDDLIFLPGSIIDNQISPLRRDILGYRTDRNNRLRRDLFNAMDILHNLANGNRNSPKHFYGKLKQWYKWANNECDTL